MKDEARRQILWELTNMLFVRRDNEKYVVKHRDFNDKDFNYTEIDSHGVVDEETLGANDKTAFDKLLLSEVKRRIGRFNWLLKKAEGEVTVLEGEA